MGRVKSTNPGSFPGPPKFSITFTANGLVPYLNNLLRYNQ